MSQALYRKWRSQTFEEVIGQDHVTRTLRNALREGRVAHAYLFSGPRGTGKTSTARILAKALNCTAPEKERPCNECPTCVAISEGRMLDLIEIDAASNNSVDDIRELRDKVGFQPSEGRYKVYIIDEVHMLSTSAFNALLKTLEEPPPHSRFVLATTEPHKIPATVLSRCQRFDFRRISVPEIGAHLRHIATAEGFQADEEALAAIARSAQGCMRDAVSLLDQMLSYGTEEVTLLQVQQVLGSVGEQMVADFVKALAEQDVATGLKIIHQLLLDGASLQEFAQQVVEHLRGVMLLQMTGNRDLLVDRSPESVAQMAAQAEGLPKNATLYAIKRFSEAIQELKGGYQPQLPLELAFIEAVHGEATTAPAQAVVQTATSSSASTTASKKADAPAIHKSASAAEPEEESGEQAEPPPLDAAAVRRLRERWDDFLVAIRDQCGLKQQAALRSVRDIAVAEHAVALAFGNNQFARSMISDAETLPQVAAVLSRFLGRSVTLECQDGDQATLSSQAGRVIDEQKKSAGPDPLVEYAVDELGAQVLDGESGIERLEVEE